MHKNNDVFTTSYRLIPMGSFSKIERRDGDKSTYELYGSSDITGMLFWNRRFDYGLVAFLGCLQQLCDHVEQQDTRFRLPYRFVLLISKALNVVMFTQRVFFLNVCCEL